jgi:hypothetical protein
MMDMAQEIKVEEKLAVPTLTPKLERFKKFLTVYRWNTPEGAILLLPILKNFGESIVWSPRIHKKGVAGAMKFTDENALMINASPDLVSEVETTRKLLEKEFKELPTIIRVELSEELKKVLA